MKPTHEQDAVATEAAALRAGEVLKVIAFAGAGKTSTLKEIANRRSDRGIYLAFNASIAEEAGRKMLGTSCSSKTMHSLAHGAVIRQGGGKLIKMDGKTVMEGVQVDRYNFARVPGWTSYRLAQLVKRTLANFCASADPFVTESHAEEALKESLGDPAVIRDRDRRERAQEGLAKFARPAAQAAQDFWNSLVARNEHSHDTYLKVLDLEDSTRRDAFRGFKYVLLDEAQDLNPVQRSIVEKTGLPLVAVGDPYQQIYSWRGAQNALDLLPGKSLYLTQSFRFGEKIASVAREILAARPDGGPEHKLSGTERSEPIRSWNGPVGAFICRTNMGVLETGLKAAKTSKHPIYIDNFDQIVTDVRVARALHSGERPREQSQKLASFTSFAEMELEAEAGDAELGRLVKIIKDERDPDVFKLADLCVKTEAESKITIITGHRSKGREWPTVRLGVDWKSMDEIQMAYEKSKRISPQAEVQAMEQFNVLYVALTRAMQKLVDPMPTLYPPEVRDPIVEEYNRMQGEIDARRHAEASMVHEGASY